MIMCALLLIEYQGVFLYISVLVFSVRKHVGNFIYVQLATQRGWVT